MLPLINISISNRKCNVSLDSARRDLRILEEKNLLKRTHGGAIPTRQIVLGKPSKMTCKDITEVKENHYEKSPLTYTIQYNFLTYILIHGNVMSCWKFFSAKARTPLRLNQPGPSGITSICNENCSYVIIE